MLYRAFEDSPKNNILKARYKNTDADRHNKTSVAAISIFASGGIDEAELAEFAELMKMVAQMEEFEC